MPASDTPYKNTSVKRGWTENIVRTLIHFPSCKMFAEKDKWPCLSSDDKNEQLLYTIATINKNKVILLNCTLTAFG